MQKKKNIFLISFVSSLNLISCAGVNASEKHESKPEPSVANESKSESEKSTNETEKNNNKDGNFVMSTFKKHPVASTLVPVSVISLALFGGRYLLSQKGDSGGGGGPSSKAKATIDAVNKLTNYNSIESFISDLGSLGDNTIRVVVNFYPETQCIKWCSYVNSTKENLADARWTIVNIISDALNNDLNKNEYIDRNVNLKLPRFKNFGWLRLLQDVKIGDKKYIIWFGMDKNNEDLLIDIDLSLGNDWK